MKVKCSICELIYFLLIYNLVLYINIFLIRLFLHCVRPQVLVVSQDLQDLQDHQDPQDHLDQQVLLGHLDLQVRAL